MPKKYSLLNSDFRDFKGTYAKKNDCMYESQVKVSDTTDKSSG